MIETEEETDPDKELVNFDPIPHNHHECERIIINISGERYETYLRTLHRYPDTLLGDPKRRLRYFDPDQNEYFFDRNRPSFDAVLYYYQSEGMLLRPEGVPLDIFCEELQFYDLDKEAIQTFKIGEGFMVEEEEPLPPNLFQREVYLLLEHPETSTPATIFAVFSVFVICFSIFLFCLETVPSFNRYVLFQMDENTTLVEEDQIPDFGNPFFCIESMCIAWFCFEMVLRFLSCPDKVVFAKDIMNLVDVMAILPYFLTLATVLSEDENAVVTKVEGEEEGFSVANLKVTRVARVFRILKLSRHSKGLRIILMTFKASINEIILLVYLLSIMSVLFSSMVYFAEANSEDSFFKSIPSAFWWSIVTMTTVGYGDVTPIALWGKIVGAVCVFAGLLILALPSPFIETNFLYYYTREGKQQAFMTENPDHVEGCPFLPGHSNSKRLNVSPLQGSGSQTSLDILLSTQRAKREKEMKTMIQEETEEEIEKEEEEQKQEILENEVEGESADCAEEIANLQQVAKDENDTF